MTFVVLEARSPQGERKQKLVSVEDFEDNEERIDYYFPSGRGYKDFRNLGEVEIIGDAEDDLDEVYSADL